MLLLEQVVSLGGDPFVGNAALVSFATSPVGMVSFAVAGIGLILVNVLALGGQSLILWDARLGTSVSQPRTWYLLISRLPSLLAISVMVLGLALLLMAPVAAIAISARYLWLSSGDFYFYISTRPPEFIAAALVTATAASISALLGLYVLLRAGLALPACLLGPKGVLSALRSAMRATSGRVRVLLPGLLLTTVALMLLWIGVSAVLYRLLEALLARPVTDEALQTLSLIFVVAAAFTFAALTGLSRAALLLVLMTDRAAEQALPVQPQPDPIPAARVWQRLLGAALIFAAVPTIALIETARASELHPDRMIAITAHRSGSARAPENTLEALRMAIADGADDVEIDVQETADGHVVLLHDTDLRRVAGVARFVWDMRLNELQALDAGSWFSPRFQAERIPTLDQFAAAARGKVGLNVELKNNQHEEDLPARVVAVLRETGTSDRAVISSLDLGLLREVRRIAPEIKVGLIMATGIGNLHRLNVDFFALSLRLATPAVIREIHSGGRQVHVWTLDDEASIARALLAGADNIITSDPSLGLKMRRWFDGMNEAQRTLLRIEIRIPGFARPRGPAPSEPLMRKWDAGNISGMSRTFQVRRQIVGCCIGRLE